MSVRPAGACSRASWTFDLVVTVAGPVVAVCALVLALRTGDRHDLLVGVPVGAALIAALGYYEIRLPPDRQDSVEPWVSLESAGLVFLAFQYDLGLVLLAWVVGHLGLVLFSEVTSVSIRLFNFGLFLSSGAVALAVIHLLAGSSGTTTLTSGTTAATVAAASASYVLFMYGVLIVSVAMEEHIPLRRAVGVRNTIIAVGAIVAINSLGFLAILLREAYPLWTTALLAVPAGAVLAASHLLSRSQLQGRQLESLAEELNHLAHHDALTGLPNRKMFLERADVVLAGTRSSPGAVAVLFLDLDGFKAVNDRHGHGAGDTLLVEVAGRLRNCVRDVDLVGRIGGDEFVVLVEKVAAANDLFVLADRIIGCLSQPFVLRGHRATVGTSVGIALAGHDDDAATVMHNADSAMYEAKAAGKNRASLFGSPAAGAATG